MLDIRRVLAAKPKPHEDVRLRQLTTEWGERLDREAVLPEHPRPQFAREGVTVLNGMWTCGFARLADRGLDACPEEADCPTPIVVPFSPEAPLSGVNRQLQPAEVLLYRRVFELDALPAGERLVLHFDAVRVRGI